MGIKMRSDLFSRYNDIVACITGTFYVDWPLFDLESVLTMDYPSRILTFLVHCPPNLTSCRALAETPVMAVHT